MKKITAADRIMLRVIRVTLTDGSEVYDLAIGSQRIACENEIAAVSLANAIEAGSLDTQFDGWNVLEERQ